MNRRSLFAAAVFVVLAPAVPGWAKDPVTRELVISNHRFEPAEIEVPASQPVVIHLRNLDNSAEEFDSSALKVEKVVGGHGEGTVHIRPLAPGRYEFMGEYHPDTARGAVLAK